MAHINLLPWREALRKERKRQFSVMAGGSVILTLLMLVYIHFHVNQLIKEQSNRNSFLEGKIAEVEKKIIEIQTLETDKQNLLARMKIIQQLQSSRPEIVHLYQELAQTIPDGVYLTRLDVAGSALKIEGVAESNANVSAFMRNLDSSTWIAKPSLEVIDSSKSEYLGMSWFSMRATQIRPSEEKVDASNKEAKK